MAAEQRRLLVRAGVLMVQHAWIVSVVSCLAGIFMLLLLPVLAKRVYVDENALIPGSGRPAFGLSEAVNARSWAAQLDSIGTDQVKVQAWLVHQFEKVGRVDYYFQHFCPPAPSFSSFQFFSSPLSSSSGCETPGINIIGILRAPKGDGNEAIAVVTPYDYSAETSVAVGLGLSLFQLLRKAQWLAKNIVWVVADARHGRQAGVAAWLKEYHEPELNFEQAARMPQQDLWLDEWTAYNFKRAGSITAGLVLELNGSSSGLGVNTLQIQAEGSNGQMPNLDLISIVTVLVSWRADFHLRIDEVAALRNWRWAKALGQIVQDVSRELARPLGGLLPEFKAGYTAEDYVNGLATFVSSCWKQMLGVPTGPHGAFRDYQVDAITLKVSAAGRADDVDLLLNYGRLVEEAVRSLNNLLEKFHHSVFLYILVSPTKFVSISTYVIPFALLLINFPVQAAALCWTPTSNRPKDWVQAIQVILLVEIWSLGTGILPMFLSKLPGDLQQVSGTNTRLLLWVMLSFLGLLSTTSVLPRKKASPEWFIPLKAWTLGLTGIGLGIMLAVDFPVALVGCLLLLPMCLSAQPASLSFNSALKPALGPVARVCSSLSPLLTAGPLLLLLGLSAVMQQQVWSWAESLWFWGSSLYVFFFLVHLPSCIICLYILCS